MILILILWLILILAGLSVNKVDQQPFSLLQTSALRGICAIEIMIGHIGLATGSLVLYQNRKAGILFVGIFFILSGYGVACSVDHKMDYMKHFLINRMVKLLLPAYAIKVIMLITANWLFDFVGGGISRDNFFTDLNWYVWEQLLFYFVYWLAWKVVPAYVELSVGIFSGLFIVFAYMSGMDNPWYGSSLCFALGLYYYRYEKRNSGQAVFPNAIGRKALKYYILLLTLLFITGTSIMLFFILGNDSILGNPVARNIASLSFGIAMIILLYKVRVGNRVSRLLGKCSYEIFLIHPYMISFLPEVSAGSKLLYGLLVVVFSVVFAFLIHLVVEKIFYLLSEILKLCADFSIRRKN